MEPTGSLFLVKEMFGIRAFADICLVAAVLYFLYRTLLRLGTWKIVTGIVLAVALFSVASMLDLRGIEWIYSNLSPVAVIGLIVIFQPELRKVFERAASMRRIDTASAGDELTQIISGALMKLAELRRGAIVILPGKEPIREWLSGGYPLDSSPSFPLIMSIFDPHSPGHDGALLIMNGRFSRFGLRLPISQASDKLPEEMGTRHHAAMGLAEKSDALVLVVSEERGAISLFLNGRYQRVDHREQMVAAIVDHWKQTASSPIAIPSGRIRLPGFAQIGASFALAAVFWIGLTITQGEILERVVTVPIEYTATSQGLALISDKQMQVRVHLAGTKSMLKSMSTDKVAAKLDLTQAGAGKQIFLITPDNIQRPKGVQVVDIVPASVELTIAAILEKEVKINAQLIGSLPGKRSLKSVQVYPDRIKVLVPSDGKNSEIPAVMTTPIYLESVTGDAVVFAKIIAPPPLQPVDKRWPDVEVRLRLNDTPAKSSE